MLTQPTVDALQTIVVPFPAGLPLRRCREAPALDEEIAPAQPHGTAPNGVVQTILKPFGCDFPPLSIVHFAL